MKPGEQLAVQLEALAWQRWSLGELQMNMEFPKIRGTLSGIPIIRTIVFWGLYWGPLILGNYHIYLGWTSVFLAFGLRRSWV